MDKQNKVSDSNCGAFNHAPQILSDTSKYDILSRIIDFAQIVSVFEKLHTLCTRICATNMASLCTSALYCQALLNDSLMVYIGVLDFTCSTPKALSRSTKHSEAF